MKLGRRPSFKRTTSMLQYPSPETIVIFYYEWSWAEGTASKGQVQCSNIQVQQQSWFQSFVIRNEVGPQAQLHKDKSNGPTSKSRNDNDLLLKMKLGLNKSNAPTSESRSKYDLLLKMKLGRRPSFKRTSPMLQHPSPEQIIISYEEWRWAEGPASKGQVQWPIIHAQKQSWFVICIKNEAESEAQGPKDKPNAPASKSRNNNTFLFRMKLGRRHGFKEGSPMLQHRSPETRMM